MRIASETVTIFVALTTMTAVLLSVTVTARKLMATHCIDLLAVSFGRTFAPERKLYAVTHV